MKQIGRHINFHFNGVIAFRDKEKRGKKDEQVNAQLTQPQIDAWNAAEGKLASDKRPCSRILVQMPAKPANQPSTEWWLLRQPVLKPKTKGGNMIGLWLSMMRIQRTCSARKATILGSS